MEHVYTAYTKEVNNQQLFFVKKFSSFPELENVDPVIESLGMHPDFYRACDMAQVYDENVVRDLYSQLHIIPEAEGSLSAKSDSVIDSLIKNTRHALVRLRIAGI